MATPAEVSQALEVQRVRGGPLVNCLLELGRLKPSDIEPILREAPQSPNTIAETGLSITDVINLATKWIFSTGEVTPSMLADMLKLPPSAVQEMLDEADARRLLVVMGAAHGAGSSELRYALSDKGIQWAHDATRQSQYIGPAPVTYEAFCDRIGRQRIARETVGQSAIDAAFGDLVISRDFILEIGPAINSGRSILLYGPPGNGKSSVGSRIGGMFREVVYIPYCFEVDGQIIKVFDEGIHRPVATGDDFPDRGASLHRDELDPRWVPCWRPLVITGGELTLEMLDLSYNVEAKFYEAPAHVKALGGVFMIDDFGRQLVSPTALLNRWIVPMENRVDYLKLHTGKTFSIPFDELLIFSTNLSPEALMDGAFLRRIPYKIEMAAPSAEQFHRIFQQASQAAGLEVASQVIDAVISELRDRRRLSLASYQPRFIVDQVLAASRFEGVPPEYRPDFIAMALGNLHAREAAEPSATPVTGASVSPIRAA